MNINRILNNYRNVIEKLIDKTKVNLNLDRKIDTKILNYILSDYNDEYYVPNLHNVYIGKIADLYEMINIIKPKNVKDFKKVLCLNRMTFFSKNKLLDILKSNSIDNIISSSEDLFQTAMNHNISEVHLKEINNLEEIKKIIIESSLFNNNEVEQIQNIKKIVSSKDIDKEFEYIYYLTYFKLYHNEVFRNFIEESINAFVGPFFYINNKIHAHKELVKKFDHKLHFINSELSHFTYFIMLKFGDDYSYYPRGRVLYDNLNKKFLVYIDRKLNNLIIKETILKEYNLKNYKVNFLFDEHYTHYTFEGENYE